MTTTRTVTALLVFVLSGSLGSGCSSANNAAGPTPTCTHAVASSGQTVGSDGGVYSTTIVTTSATCSWNATSDVSWIDLTVTSGRGSGAVAYAVRPNAGAGRSGVITLHWTGGHADLMVTQAGPA